MPSYMTYQQRKHMRLTGQLLGCSLIAVGLSMGCEIDWTGRQLRRDKAGRIPAEFSPILERLDCTEETWLDLVKNFRKRFRTEAGRPATLQGVSSLRRSRRHANLSA